jgi:hypothetical protein
LSCPCEISPSERIVVKEVDCQVHEHSPRCEYCWELFLGEIGISCRDLIHPVHIIAITLEGNWGSRGTVEKRSDTLPWVYQLLGE